MRVSREKINQLSHVIADVLAERPELTFEEDRNSVRLEVRRLLEEMLAAETRMDEEARKKIATQKKPILEGTEEWDVLYRRYYQEELKKLGV